MRVHLTVAAIALAVPMALVAPGAQAAEGKRVPVPTVQTETVQKTKSAAVVPLTRNMRFADYPTADIRTRDSKWTGFELRHPRGGRLYPTVTRWANLVLAVMGEHRIRAKFLPGILAQIQQESSGNPYAINMWDSNASRGTPSKGLLQVILPTYRAYAKPGFKSSHYQTVPYTNIWAALNYVINRYGRGKFASWNRGYNQGY